MLLGAPHSSAFDSASVDFWDEPKAWFELGAAAHGRRPGWRARLFGTIGLTVYPIDDE
jgi:hypothetical protein